MASHPSKCQVAPEGVRELLEAVRRTGKPDRYAGKRKAERFSDGSPLEMATDPGNPAGVQVVYLHNLSETGFAFWARSRMDTHIAIYIRAADDEGTSWVRGRITHCTHGLRGYLIGGHFEL